MNIKVTGWTNWYDENYKDIKEWDENEENPFVYNDLIIAIAKELREKGYKFTGDYHQNSECYEENYGGVPIINNLYKFTCSCRAWGGIMATAYPEYGTDEYAYCIWAWIPPMIKKQNGEDDEYEKQHFPKAEDYK